MASYKKGKPELRRRPRLLFVDPTNGARTQMAEAYGRQMLSDRIEVRSAGFIPHGVDPRARQVLEADGVDAHGLYAKVLDQGLLEWADLVVTLSTDAHDVKLREQDSYIRKHWPMDDPARLARDGEDVAPYINTRDDIKRRVRQFANSIRLTNR
jgi:arsenate reductase (thioredoxin)